MDGSQFLLHCTDLNVTQLKTINTARSLAGAVCTIMVLSILIYTIVRKAFVTVLQRLFIYLVLATVLQEALIAVSFEHQFQYPGQDELCTGYGFIIQWSGVVMFNFALGIMLYLLYLVYAQLRRVPCAHITKSNKVKKTLECIYVVFILTFPLTYLWIPFLHENYGLSGASCWMRALNDNCTNVGLADQLIFAYGAYEGVGAAAILVSISISIVYCKVSNIYPDAKRLIRRTLSLTAFLLAYVVVISIPLAIRLQAGITGSRQHFILWITWAIAIPISHTIFIFGFLFSFYSGNICRCLNTKFNPAKICHCLKKGGLLKAHENAETDHDATIKPSERVSLPSVTYFSIPYTDGFTDASPAEKRPLVHKADTGYSTCSATDS